MHSLLFAVLGALLTHSLYGRLVGAGMVSGSYWRWCSALRCCKRAFSCLASGAYIHGDNFFDIGVDMLGGVVGRSAGAGLSESYLPAAPGNR